MEINSTRRSAGAEDSGRFRGVSASLTTFGGQPHFLAFSAGFLFFFPFFFSSPINRAVRYSAAGRGTRKRSGIHSFIASANIGETMELSDTRGAKGIISNVRYGAAIVSSLFFPSLFFPSLFPSPRR